MRILFLDQFSESGGAQLCLRDLLAEALRRGWDAELMAPGDGPLHDYCRRAGIRSSTLPLGDYAHGRKRFADFARYPLDMLRAGIEARQRYRAFLPHIIYVNGPRVLTAAHGLPCPIVFHSHSLLNRGYSQRLVKWGLSANATIIAACHHVAAALPGSPRVLYNGVADQGFLARPRERARLHIGMVGRIAPEKGQIDFVMAARLLAQSNPDVAFSVTGETMYADPGYAASVREAAGSSVEFRDWTADISTLLHELDVLVVPSGAVDATPRIVMEGLSAGTPIVAYRSGGIPELLDHEETGLFAEERSPEALAEAVGRLLESPGLMARLSAGGRKAWEHRFRLDRYRNDVFSVLEEIYSIHRSKLLPSTMSAVM